MVLVRATTAADWRSLRDTRLAALRDAPDAFATTYAQDAAITEAEWRDRATRWHMFLAFIPEAGIPEAGIPEAGIPEPGEIQHAGAQAAGMAGCFAAEAGSVHLVAMFVRPQARGLGVGEALIDTVLGWARDHDATSVDLWVTETNTPARRLYERRGFTPDGRRQPLPSNPALTEIAMSRAP
jgi:GNAT superfamily N-acetyltransferase